MPDALVRNDRLRSDSLVYCGAATPAARCAVIPSNSRVVGLPERLRHGKASFGFGHLAGLDALRNDVAGCLVLTDNVGGTAANKASLHARPCLPKRLGADAALTLDLGDGLRVGTPGKQNRNHEQKSHSFLLPRAVKRNTQRGLSQPAGDA